MDVVWRGDVVVRCDFRELDLVLGAFFTRARIGHRIL